MVRTEAEIEQAARIEGGFVLVEVPWLIAAWRACRFAPLKIGDFRTLLACREMVARRCRINETRDRSLLFDHPELAKLLGTTERRARASVRRLEAAGLLTWTADSISFPAQAFGDDEKACDSIGQGKGSIAIPRRILRFLASGARPALIATILGVLLRCLSRRRAGFDGRGRVKASWVAKAFGISVRQIKGARAELVGLGWIAPEESSQWALNQWGKVYRIDLGWQAPTTCLDGSNLTPPPADPGRESSPPDLQTRNPSGREENQDPGPEPAGIEIKEEGEESRKLADTKLAPLSTKLVQGQPLPAPTLADVRVKDLKDTGRLLQLRDQAVAKGLVTTSEADRLRVVAAAEHALVVGKANPAGLFAYLVRNRAWRYLTGEDEDRANARLKDHVRGPEPSGTSPTTIPLRPDMTPSPRDGGSSKPHAASTLLASDGPIVGLSEDAQFVRDMRAATIRAGIFRDPFPAIHGRDPKWTRERWDRALVELGLG